MVISHLDVPFGGTVHATVTRASPTRFFLAHPLGETKIHWPSSAHVSMDENGMIELHGIGVNAGKPFLTLVPMETRESSAGRLAMPKSST
jgi:hypothetical protein